MGDYKNNTYYSTKDKTLFVIPAYYTHGTGYAEPLVNNINDVCDFLVGELKVKRSDINCFQIQKSIRYKHKWLFFVNDIEDNLPSFVRKVDELVSDFIQ